MKTIKWTALPLAAVLSLPFLTLVAPAGAQPRSPSHDIVVQATPRATALTNWSNRVQADLERQMEMPRYLGPTRPFIENGVAQVRFIPGDSGRADQIILARSSGSSRIDHAALHAVDRLTSLRPLPEGMQPDQKILAQLLFIGSPGGDRDNDRRIRALKQEAAKDNAWFYGGQTASSEVIMLTAAR